MAKVITGTISVPQPTQKALTPSSSLYLGTQCNDGRPITQSWRYQQALKQGNPIIRRRPPPPRSTPVKVRKEPFVTKYAPKSITDIIGHKEAISQLTTWLQSWDNGAPEKRGILITGPPGIGKTSTVHLVAESLAYYVSETNASDTRSVTLLRGLFGLGMKRLRKEVVVMDEVDGLSGGAERGGIGELADLIRKTNTPIICIANTLPPKLKPLQNACLAIKFSRPVKSTIATALTKIAKAEGIALTKAELETMCEKSGNDIRSLLNTLEFYGSHNGGDKDANLRQDLFSATAKLIGNKRLSHQMAEDLVYVDYGMVPLMVQEGYLAASKDSLENAVLAAEEISFGDTINKRLWSTQDWTLLPHVVHTTVAVARTVSGPAPFQMFPQLLGKNSKKAKHRRWMEDAGRHRHLSGTAMRLDEAEYIQKILAKPLTADKPDVKGTIARLDTIRLTRDQLMENITETLFHPVEIPTKTKTAFTREYNKSHSKAPKKAAKGSEDEEIDDEEVDEITDELENVDLD